MDKEKKNEERIQSEPITYPEIEEQEETIPPIDTSNLCSWLLIFTPEELSILACILAILVSVYLTIEEKAVVGSFLTAFSDNLFLIAAQQSLIDSALNKQKEIDDLKKEIINKKHEKEQKKIDQKEKLATQQELETIKEQLKRIEILLNKQLKI